MRSMYRTYGVLLDSTKCVHSITDFIHQHVCFLLKAFGKIIDEQCGTKMVNEEVAL